MCSVTTLNSLCNYQTNLELQANYGRDDQEAVETIKELYRELQLEAVFEKYEQASYDKLVSEIQQQKELPEEVFSLLLKKIYKRSK